ncbi:hypothetical protein BAUCODRAFT_27047 [Baudoinia panamericana UAMH 10762]|uniref:Histone chaperone domain-containing protein n=1 Tax=Baudoinia panamericana (strain UAMH 10762) TaxID=717646 RepID=M2MMP8_BAUPA|nr:uncharacterized protein BAUCODRAFT_27047 [Baudoinia panamericana UAMH 10762]EMC92693.1 hypothetical protein BAUCODRAFT_27047 [Baudoinia panamericana UAMH 10762]
MSTSARDDGDAPTGIATDNDYVSRTGQKEGPIPVQKDEAGVEDPIDPATADSDEQLGTHSTQHVKLVRKTNELPAKDDTEAINQNNIINERTRGATKKAGTYQEPGDEEGLPGPEDGTSNIRTGR